MPSFIRRYFKSKFFSWTIGVTAIAGVLLLGRIVPGGIGRGLGRLPDDGKLHVVFFDVGQGDAALIRTPSGDDILVDGGPDSGVVRKLGETLPVGDRDIELLILTHPHADHVTGLVDVFRRYEVHRVIFTGVVHTTDVYRAFLEAVRDEGVTAELPGGGGEVVQGDVRLEFLWPEEDYSGKSVSETGAGEAGGLNDTSIVFRLVYGDTEVLFTGDATLAVEKSLLASSSSSSSSSLRSDVLKVGHHGSNNSTGREFLAVVDPDVAVVSSGVGNIYGHPSYRIIKRLRDAGVRLFRTDQNGDILIESDGVVSTVRSERGELASEPSF